MLILSDGKSSSSNILVIKNKMYLHQMHKLQINIWTFVGGWDWLGVIESNKDGPSLSLLSFTIMFLKSETGKKSYNLTDHFELRTFFYIMYIFTNLTQQHIYAKQNQR